jgi:hypothetical protein
MLQATHNILCHLRDVWEARGLAKPSRTLGGSGLRDGHRFQGSPLIDAAVEA